jgi:hypothetical protein
MFGFKKMHFAPEKSFRPIFESISRAVAKASPKPPLRFE